MSRKSRDEYLPVGDAIRELLNTYRLNAKFDQTQVVNAWERLVGKPVARQTRRVFMKNKVLFAEFTSPAIKHDFVLHKEKILALFRKEFGAGVVEEIVVL